MKTWQEGETQLKEINSTLSLG